MKHSASKDFYYTMLQKLPYELRRSIYSVVNKRSYCQMQKRRSKITATEGSYKPFDDTKSIFIHIPKAAGVSICKTLYGNLAGGHTAVDKYQYVFSKAEFYSYFRFTFVRNPWDRLFSAYNFLKNGGLNDVDKKWAEMNLSPYNNFQQFVKKGLRLKNITNYIHFIPQYKFLCLPDTSIMPIDYLGFFENIEKDFVYVSQKVTGKEIKLPILNKNKKTNTFYKGEYDQEMVSIVEKIYCLDIERFGYSFDNSLLSKQIEKRDLLYAQQ